MISVIGGYSFGRRDFINLFDEVINSACGTELALRSAMEKRRYFDSKGERKVESVCEGQKGRKIDLIV